MARIVAYHPRIGVRGADGTVYVLTANLKSWASAEEVLELLGRAAYVRTAGELVEVVRSFQRGELVWFKGDTNNIQEFVEFGVGCSVADEFEIDRGLIIFPWDHVISMI